MQVAALAPFLRDNLQAQEARDIVGTCVHCGFCTATCPTYQVLGNELDSPRGRIYLMKQMVEGQAVTEATRTHLDRCLTCRSCETTCPAGVEYGHLIDLGRNLVEELQPRSWRERMQRTLLRKALLNRPLFALALKAGRMLRPLLPAKLKASVPAARTAGAWPVAKHKRVALILEGCVQAAIAPNFDAALARVLDRAGVSLKRVGGGCCGAVSQHLSAHEEALDYFRCNIDAWWPHIESGAEVNATSETIAVVATSSGCGAVIKDYGHLLRHDPAYAAKAARISDLFRDTAQIIEDEWAPLQALLNTNKHSEKLAFHPPCSLQHGLAIQGLVEKLLRDAGYTLTPVRDSHLCCGSAGTYSILQPVTAQTLKTQKLMNLEAGQPQRIVTANIGCMTHLQSGTDTPVRHWIELLDERLNGVPA